MCTDCESRLDEQNCHGHDSDLAFQDKINDEKIFTIENNYLSYNTSAFSKLLIC